MADQHKPAQTPQQPATAPAPAQDFGSHQQQQMAAAAAPAVPIPSPMNGSYGPGNKVPQTFGLQGNPGYFGQAMKTDFQGAPKQTMDTARGAGMDKNFLSNFYFNMNPAEKVAFSMMRPEQQQAQMQQSYQQNWTQPVAKVKAPTAQRYYGNPAEVAAPAPAPLPTGYNPFMAQRDPFYDTKFNSTYKDGLGWIPNAKIQSGSQGSWIGAANPGDYTAAVPGLNGQKIPFSNLRADDRGMWVV